MVLIIVKVPSFALSFLTTAGRREE